MEVPLGSQVCVLNKHPGDPHTFLEWTALLRVRDEGYDLGGGQAVHSREGGSPRDCYREGIIGQCLRGEGRGAGQETGL